MLYEFHGQFDAVKTLLTQGIAIAGNDGIDDIDLSVLDEEAAELASMCFGSSGKATIPQTIALKEAFDFVVSHRRLMDEHGHGREAYYEDAGKHLEKMIERYEYLNAVLQRFDRKGAL